MTGMVGGSVLGPALASSLPLGSSLPRLAQETELQKLLADERMRSEQHKTNYQQLKLEHAKCVGGVCVIYIHVRLGR